MFKITTDKETEYINKVFGENKLRYDLLDLLSRIPNKFDYKCPEQDPDVCATYYISINYNGLLGGEISYSTDFLDYYYDDDEDDEESRNPDIDFPISITFNGPGIISALVKCIIWCANNLEKYENDNNAFEYQFIREGGKTLDKNIDPTLEVEKIYESLQENNIKYKKL